MMQTAFGLLMLATLAAIQARAIRGTRRHHLQELCRGRGCPEAYDQIMAAGGTIAFVAASVVVITAVLATLLISQQPVAGTRIGMAAFWTLLCWVMLVIIPTATTRLAGGWVVVATWRLWRPVVRLAAPLMAAGRRGFQLISRFLPGSRASDADESQDEIRLAMEEAHREGHLDEEAREMIEGVMELEDVQVSEIMTPRTEMVAIPLADGWTAAVTIAIDSCHSRLPVWRASPDDIVGVLHAREVLAELARSRPAANEPEREPPDLTTLLRPPYFIPETMSVQKLLRELQRGNSHMAIVTDEFGGVCGLVTIEDALEEIVGEIADEHDEAFTDGILVLSEDACETLANVPTDDLNERMHFGLPEEADFDTIGGFAFHVFGRIPQVGERIEADGVAIEVLAATRRRITRLRVSRLPAPAEAS
jgi:CBS domain containing-hemolysin-like protein